MDNANYDPRMLLDVVHGELLAQDPFVLVDVGCGLGLDPAWRQFGSQLEAYAFDAQVVEVERLAREEKNPRVHYHAALVGLPDDHPIPTRRRARLMEEAFFEPFARTSTATALERASAAGDVPFYETNNWPALELSSEKVGLAAFLRGQNVSTVDFVKTDTDGGDLDVLLSFEEMIAPAGVLGFMVETMFTGSDDESVHTFHNVDRLLKRHGFMLCAITANRYSRAALPAQFKYSIMAQTVTGQPLWGDMVYLRDAVHPDHVRFGELSPIKLLKLACLYELFRVPDCAAEILLAHRERLAPLVDVDRMLDLLTPPLDGQVVSYREYIAAFEADPTRFYPRAHEPEAPFAPASARPTLVQRTKHLAARALRG